MCQSERMFGFLGMCATLPGYQCVPCMSSPCERKRAPFVIYTCVSARHYGYRFASNTRDVQCSKHNASVLLAVHLHGYVED